MTPSARCAMWSRTICCKFSPWSRWTHRPAAAPMTPRTRRRRCSAPCRRPIRGTVCVANVGGMPTSLVWPGVLPPRHAWRCGWRSTTGTGLTCPSSCGPARRCRITSPRCGCSCAALPGSPSFHCPDRGQGPCDLFQRFALRGDPEHDLDQAADDHHAATDQVADEQPERIATVADQVAVDFRPERAEALGDGEEDGDGLGADLQREDLADSQVGGARAGGGEEEEDDAPGDRLGGGVSTPWLNR